MSYQSLYRRFRPQRFGEVRGQEHLVRALRNAVAEDRVGHAYLLSGPRGTGKTTTARILAKALNCPNLIDGEPCGECESCLSIESGRSFDLQELDAASNRGIGEMKSLLETIALGTPGRTKVYILDEVHMLTKEASAALLKTLEEPPPHVVFVLATTDPQKVLPTIRSRTQHFELHLLAATDLRALLDDVVAEAGLDIVDDQIEYALRRGAGSARDTLSMLDQVAAAGSAPESAGALEHLVDAMVQGDAGRALAGVQEALVAGREPRAVGESLLEELRDAFLTSQQVSLDHRSEAAQARARAVCDAASPRVLTRALEILGEALVEMRQASDPRIPLEVALLRIARPESDESMAAVLARLDRLERALAEGTTGVSSAPSDSVPASEASAAVASAPGSPAPGSPASGSAAAGARPTPSASPESQPASITDPDSATSAGDGSPGPEPSSEPEPATAPSSGGDPDATGPARPADSARRVLAARLGENNPPATARAEPTTPKKGDRPALGAHRTGGADGPPPAAETVSGGAGADGAVDAEGEGPGGSGAPGASEAPAATVDGGGGDGVASAAAEPRAVAESPVSDGSGGAPGAGGAMPTRDELTLAWGDAVLPTLHQRTRVRWAPGRFVSVTDEAALFGLSNQITCDRCADQRGEVEAALAEHFGRPVPVKLVVDDGHGDAGARAGRDGDGSSSMETDPMAERAADEDLGGVDSVHQLEDADASDGVTRLTEAFPGAKFVDPGES